MDLVQKQDINLVQNSILFKVEQPLQNGKYIGYFFIEDIHVYSFQCMTGCPSCFTEASCPPCPNPANKNPQDCTCLSDCPSFCTTCITIGSCVDCVIATQRLNPPNCNSCPDTFFIKLGLDNCQSCQIGCLKCIELANCNNCHTNQCLLQCPDGYFNDSINSVIDDPKCTICNSNCLQLIKLIYLIITCDITATQCTACIPKGYLVNSYCHICLEGEYFSGTSCAPCINGCQKCISLTCQQCLEGYYYMLSKNQCQSICDDGYFGNYQARQCQVCESSCKHVIMVLI